MLLKHPKDVTQINLNFAFRSPTTWDLLLIWMNFCMHYNETTSPVHFSNSVVILVLAGSPSYKNRQTRMFLPFSALLLNVISFTKTQGSCKDHTIWEQFTKVEGTFSGQKAHHIRKALICRDHCVLDWNSPQNNCSLMSLNIIQLIQSGAIFLHLWLSAPLSHTHRNAHFRLISTFQWAHTNSLKADKSLQPSARENSRLSSFDHRGVISPWAHRFTVPGGPSLLCELCMPS